MKHTQTPLLALLILVRKSLIALLMLWSTTLPTAWAQTIPPLLDPATLHIGPGAGTPCATGCAGDPNLVGTAGVDIYQNSGGAPNLFDPVLLILGVPNSTGAPGSLLSSVTYYNPYPGGSPTAGSGTYATTGQYGLLPVPTATGAGGYFGSFTSSSGGDVYSFLSLLGGNGSNNWTNWSGTDFTKNGITANNFGIYVYALSGPALGPNGLIDIRFGGESGLSKGTFAIAYGEKCSTGPGNGCFYSTPFTEAGLSASTAPAAAVPEPEIYAMMGIGLALMGFVARRRTLKEADAA